MTTTTTEAGKTASKTQGFDFKNCLSILADLIKNPIKGIEKASTNFKDAKFAWIFAGISLVVCTILSILSKVFASVVGVSYSFSKGITRKIDWGNIGDIDFWQATWTSFVTYLAIIIGIAGIAFIVSLIMKKRPAFQKLVGIIAAVVIFYAVGSLIASILNLIWAPLQVIVSVVTSVFCIIIAVAGIDKEVALTDNARLWFYLIVSSSAFLIAYWLISTILVDLVKGSITKGLGF